MVNYEKFINQSLRFLEKNDIQIEKCFYKYIEKNVEKAKLYKNALAEVKTKLEKDVDFFTESDPAADSAYEVKIAYPGYLAISYYRIAHELRKLGYLIESRMISEIAHSKTGIDVHPSAEIDSPFFIDHGTGIVIGETTVIGKRVKLYQGVTLGALSLSEGKKLKGVKRHPTIGDDVTIYSGASILGNVTVGNDVTIGSNVFIAENIPPHTKVTITKPILIFKQKS